MSNPQEMMKPIISGPDANGVVIEIFHRINADGLREKITRKYTSKNPEALVFRLGRQHKTLKPFGSNCDSKNFRMAATSVSYEDIFIELPNAPQVDILATLKKNMLGGVSTKKRRSIRSSTIDKHFYRHPNRNKMSDEIPDEIQEPSTQLRVSNLTKDAEESDLSDLFGHYGKIKRVFIAKDRVTNESRGFGFVTFRSKKDAELALEHLNGYGYGYLILKVEWATSRKKSHTYYSGYGKALPQTKK